MTAELAALADRCLLLGIQGTSPSPFMEDWLAEGLGGVILFRHNISTPAQLLSLTGALHAAGVEVLVAADEEGGDVTRLHHRDGSPHPGNLALGHVDSVAYTESVAYALGTELAAAGIDFDLAPVADVNTNPDNPIIGTRSFGSDPELVARHVAAYLSGLSAAGVIGCAKHFPGHGDTARDSHLEVPVVSGPIEPHLVPFRAAIDAGAPAILSAHIVFPSLDSRPATLSPRILTDLLRGELGFTGVVVTDSLTMDAIAGSVGLAEGAIQALAAGADLLCINSTETDHRVVRDEIVAAVAAGRIPESRLVEAAARVSDLAKRRPFGAASNDGSTTDVPVGTGAVEGRALVKVDLAVAPEGVPYVIEIAPPRRGIELSAGSLLATMQRRDPRVEGIRLYDGEAAEVPADRPIVLVVRDAHRDPRQRAIIQEHPEAIVVGIGTAYDQPLAPGRYLGTHGGARPNLAAAAEVLLT